MKKSSFIILVVFLAALFTGCAAKPTNKPEDTARKFIDTYYAQYAQKEEIGKIREDFTTPLLQV